MVFASRYPNGSNHHGRSRVCWLSTTGPNLILMFQPQQPSGHNLSTPRGSKSAAEGSFEPTRIKSRVFHPRLVQESRSDRRCFGPGRRDVRLPTVDAPGPGMHFLDIADLAGPEDLACGLRA